MAEMKAAASGTWNALETVFEDRVARVLDGLNVATKKDIDALARRISQLGAAGKKPAVGRRAAVKSASRVTRRVAKPR